MERLDILNRKEFVDKLVNLTQNIASHKASASFAINGAWGCGKSFVLDVYEERLSQIQSEETATDQYFVIRYNCWKYDYYEEPLVAIVASILETINQKTNSLEGEHKERIKGVLNAVVTALLSIPNNALKNITGVDLGAAFDVVKSGIKSGKEKYEKMQSYDTYFSFNQTLLCLQGVLNEISKQYTIVFLIDELDRCLPKYAIKVLERLHHLNENTSNVINVISIDKTQLYASIQHSFGFADVDLYLKKFIQFTISLDVGTISEKITDKYSDFTALFDPQLCPVDNSIEEFLQEIFQKIDVREQERIVQRATIAHTLLFSEPKSLCFMCAELLVTVMNSCYGSKKDFCQWLEKFARSREVQKKNPPFTDFFDDRFKELPHHEVRHVGELTQNAYEFTTNKSLYANIFYLWYKVFFDGNHREISIKDQNLRHSLAQDAEDLKHFNDVVKFIK